MNTGDTAEEPATSLSVELFKELAQEHKMSIVFGIVLRDGDKATNNELMVESGGIIKRLLKRAT